MIIGGGGHGLATAYYLAKNHGIKNIAVVERAYIGSGNVGRNTTLVRSNYVIDGNTQFFEFSMKLWEGLSHELNFNVMLSQRGQIVLAHGPAQHDGLARKGNIMRLNGIDAELLDRGDVMRMLAVSGLLRRSAISHLRRTVAATGRNGSPRCGCMGLRASGYLARRGHHRETAKSPGLLCRRAR